MNNTIEMIDCDYWPEFVFGFGTDEDEEGEDNE
ncbi:hypothetical protein J2T14_001619 [Paenibacillus harenae]|nr:hypothetical protein [Paenibacillus harenae]